MDFPHSTSWSTVYGSVYQPQLVCPQYPEQALAGGYLSPCQQSSPCTGRCGDAHMATCGQKQLQEGTLTSWPGPRGWAEVLHASIME